MTNVIYRFNEDGIFTPPVDVAMEDPMVKGRFLTPAFASLIPTPFLKENEAARIVDIANPVEWVVVTNNIGKEAFNKTTKESFTVTEYGPLNNENTLIVCPSPQAIYQWNAAADEWEIEIELLRNYLGFLATMVVLKARAELKNPWNSAVVLKLGTTKVSDNYTKALKTYMIYVASIKIASLKTLTAMLKTPPVTITYQFCSVCGGALSEVDNFYVCDYCGFSTAFCEK